jgi:hypothetical protein
MKRTLFARDALHHQTRRFINQNAQKATPLKTVFQF